MAATLSSRASLVELLFWLDISESGDGGLLSAWNSFRAMLSCGLERLGRSGPTCSCVWWVCVGVCVCGCRNQGHI